jgi:hypothetical protein
MSLAQPVNTVSALTSSAEHSIRHHIIISITTTMLPYRQSHAPLAHTAEKTLKIFMATSGGCTTAVHLDQAEMKQITIGRIMLV